MSSRPLLIPGYPRILHGGDYNPDQWLAHPEVLDEDFRLMPLAGCNTFTLGVFAWTTYEPSEGQYDFSWLDRLMDRMAAAGNRVVLATPSGAKPAWLSARYPEVRRVDRQGRREPHHGRHNHCFTSPVFREKVRAIDERMAQRYHGHPALGMWHISNEFSGECYCDLCVAAWQRWLEARYGTVEALNAAWWSAFWSHTFTSFDEIDPRDGTLDGMTLDFARFVTAQTIDFLRVERAALRRHSPEIPCTTNLMGAFPWLDYSRIVEELDVVVDDQYPGYAEGDARLTTSVAEVSFKDDLFRCFKPDRPWMLMESCPDVPQWQRPARLKRAELHRAEMLQALGHGAEGTCYFQWRKGRGGCEKLHGAVVDHVGHEHTRVFRSVAALGADYERLTPILGSAVEAEVAILYDWEVRWAFEKTEGVRREDDAYWRCAIEHYRAFFEQGVSVDVVRPDRDLSRYKVVVAPQLFMLASGVAARLRAFVEAGGTFVATHYLGMVDEHNACLLGGWPGDGLRGVLGLWNEETDWLGAGETQAIVSDRSAAPWLAEHYVAPHVRAIVHLEGATALARYADGPFAGSPAVTVHTCGAGAAYYEAAWMPAEYHAAFAVELIGRRGLRRALAAAPPSGVAVQRRAREGREFLFLENFTPLAQSVALPEGRFTDLCTGSVSEGSLALAPWGSSVLESAAP